MTLVLVVNMPMTYGIKLGSKLASDIDGLISLSWEYALIKTLTIGRMAEYKVRARPIVDEKGSNGVWRCFHGYIFSIFYSGEKVFFTFRH